MNHSPQLLTAMCSVLQSEELMALCFELPQDGSVPEWVQLVPPGKDVVGFDGRGWINDKPELSLNRFNTLKAKGRDLVFDFEHSTELKAPKGEEAPATGWGMEMEIRDGGSIWVKPDWNESGRNSIMKKEYRYLSPVLIYEKESRRIVGISSVGLTNRANLTLKALNQEINKQQETDMVLSKAIRVALGIKDDATEDQALNAIETLKTDKATALNHAQNPSLEKFVPRADHDAMTERATNAEKSLKDNEEKALNTEIDAVVDAAFKDKKIATQSVEYHKATCRIEGGLERFKEFAKTAPKIVGDDTDLDNKDPNKEKGKALNAQEAEIAGMFGNSAEDLEKHS